MDHRLKAPGVVLLAAIEVWFLLEGVTTTTPNRFSFKFRVVLPYQSRLESSVSLDIQSIESSDSQGYMYESEQRIWAGI